MFIKVTGHEFKKSKKHGPGMWQMSYKEPFFGDSKPSAGSRERKEVASSPLLPKDEKWGKISR